MNLFTGQDHFIVVLVVLLEENAYIGLVEAYLSSENASQALIGHLHNLGDSKEKCADVYNYSENN